MVQWHSALHEADNRYHRDPNCPYAKLCIELCLCSRVPKLECHWCARAEECRAKARMALAAEPHLVEIGRGGCPNCGRILGGALVGRELRLRPGSAGGTLGSSCTCGKTILSRIVGDTDGAPRIESVMPPTRAGQQAPASVVDALAEAALCASFGAWMAAALLLRRTVEQIADDLGAQQQRDLYKKLKLLEREGQLSEWLRLAHDIRELGREAGHRDTAHWPLRAEPTTGSVGTPLSQHEELRLLLVQVQDFVCWLYRPQEVIVALYHTSRRGELCGTLRNNRWIVPGGRW